MDFLEGEGRGFRNEVLKVYQNSDGLSGVKIVKIVAGINISIFDTHLTLRSSTKRW